MAARTLERTLKSEVEYIWVSAKMITEGKERSTLRRLEWMRDILDGAIETQKKIEKRDAAKARKAEREAKAVTS